MPQLTRTYLCFNPIYYFDPYNVAARLMDPPLPDQNFWLE